MHFSKMHFRKSKLDPTSAASPILLGLAAHRVRPGELVVGVDAVHAGAAAEEDGNFLGAGLKSRLDVEGRPTP